MICLVAPFATVVGTFFPPMANFAAFCAGAGLCANRSAMTRLVAVIAGDASLGFFVLTLGDTRIVWLIRQWLRHRFRGLFPHAAGQRGVWVRLSKTSAIATVERCRNG